VGQQVTFTISINPAATGTVQIEDGSTVFATVPISAGSATYSTSALALGAHTIMAIYSGDNTYVGVGSSYFTQTVNAKATTTTTITSSQNPATVGVAVTLRASVSPASATGTVQFLDGAMVIGTSAIASGSASLTASTLAQGSHSITAVYSGDAANIASTSGVLTQTVNAKTAASVSLSSSANPSVAGAAITITAW
jgi:large repetitive protein